MCNVDTRDSDASVKNIIVDHDMKSLTKLLELQKHEGDSVDLLKICKESTGLLVAEICKLIIGITSEEG